MWPKGCDFLLVLQKVDEPGRGTRARIKTRSMCQGLSSEANGLWSRIVDPRRPQEKLKIPLQRTGRSVVCSSTGKGRPSIAHHDRITQIWASGQFLFQGSGAWEKTKPNQTKTNHFELFSYLLIEIRETQLSPHFTRLETAWYMAKFSSPIPPF